MADQERAGRLKAVSLWQPWGSLWCSDDKEHETRNRPISHRGWLVVHAAQRFVSDCGEELDGIVCDRFGPLWRSELPRGALIGAVNVVACKRTDDLLKEWGCPPAPIPTRHWIDYLCGDFSDGRFAWQREEFRRFADPIPYRGKQGFFYVEGDAALKAARQIEAP